MLEFNDFDLSTQWVRERLNPTMAALTGDEEVRQALVALNAILTGASSTFLIPDLFPGAPLDVFHVQGLSKESVELHAPGSGLLGQAGLSARALSAIGAALLQEMDATGNDMVRYPLKEAEVIIARSTVRDLILQATGITLLTD
ncbi:hypothetical protein [Castellaniella sp.]|uniref:hypothetical protein n=1 Tax=Castellaniella sp. TaxID=1955812 RepID=UPI002AFF6FB3|nr:hypothetical protein [Castellaniella sp.]